MKTIFIVFFLLVASTHATAWNGAGHRLVAALAWREMSPEARQAVHGLLSHHPDYPKWVAKPAGDPGYQAFLEASTWPDDIRRDPRYYDEESEGPTLSFPGMPDTARHRNWHYVDRLPDGRGRTGELDRQLENLIGCLRSRTTSVPERAYALPWLVHLVGDVHQPLHVGSRDDEGGNRFEIENPFSPRQPFTNLHSWWDDLPGPPWLRGNRLENAAEALAGNNPPPAKQGGPSQWEKESREIGEEKAYPTANGALLPTITPEFLAQSRAIANRQLAAAGRRLGRLLEQIFSPVPRETR